MSRTEPVELTNLCLIENGSRILLQKCHKPHWSGWSLPGGHVEPEESFVDAVVREIREETGLTILNPALRGLKQFNSAGRRYIVFLFKAAEFTGTLTDSEEGPVAWIERSALPTLETVPDLDKMIQVIDEDSLTEFQYVPGDPDWNVALR